MAGTIAKPHKPDPLLDGGPTTACAAGTDYAGGTDVHGRNVVPAEIDRGRTPVPDGIAIQLAQTSATGGRVRPTMGGSSYVELDGRKLEPLVNPAPCR